jgi:type IV pilus assembly protein PilZ
MTDASHDDRRRHLRGPIELKVEYKRVNTFFSDYTKNISNGGTFIRTDNPLGVGTEFLFKLHVPALAEPITLKGRVQWIITASSAEADESPGMGIQFIYESDTQRRQVQTMVEQLMIESFGYDLYTKLMSTSKKS